MDTANGEQIWAERYDRDLTDIFAIQDEISKAIVAALQLKLLPTEKKAIEKRGTTNPDAYNLYLLARKQWITGNFGDERRNQVVIRICKQAVTIDPHYARAWALMALAQADSRFWHGQDVDGLEAAEKALSLDPSIAEAYCVKARYLMADSKVDEANEELRRALEYDPDSWEVQKEVGHLTFRQGRIVEATPFFERASELMDSDYHDSAMLVTCYEASGDRENMIRAAQVTVDRAEKAVASDPNNGFALGIIAVAMAVLGDFERTREWIDRALLIDPDNMSMRYNLACALSSQLGDIEGAIDVLDPCFDKMPKTHFMHLQVDPDLDKLRDNPRFQKRVEDIKRRLHID